jgi:pimeloyl-ACP methyl ester carboxylesterase
MHSEVSGSALVEVAGSGHSVFYEDPAVFNAEVLSFLNNVTRIS